MLPVSPIKMRVLCSSTKPKIRTYATALGEAFNCQTHDVPPAYPCEKERLVILGISAKNDIDDVVRRFCCELNPKKASNVAIVIDGNESVAAKVVDALKIAGTNIIPEIKYLTCGLFKSKLTDEESADLMAWLHNIVENQLV